MTFTGRPGEETSDEYATPPEIWRPISNAIGGFDLDPCSGAESQPIAPERYTKEEDGLSQGWFGKVWMNPPFGDRSGPGTSSRGEWLHKARNEISKDSVELVVALLPVDTSTSWFHDHIVPADTICFLSSRPQFEGESVHTGFACLIAVYGETPEELAGTLEEMGAVFRGRVYYRTTVQQQFIVGDSA